MARTSLGPQKIARDMGSSSHWGLIMAPVQEANSDNLGKIFFDFMIVCWVYSLESHLMSTHNIPFHDKIRKKIPKDLFSWAIGRIL